LNFPGGRDDFFHGLHLVRPAQPFRRSTLDLSAFAYESAHESIVVPWHFSSLYFNGPILCRRKIVYCVKKSIKKFIGGGLVAFMCLIMAPAAMAAPVTGAIFTTLFDGSAVDFNIYDTKEDVYLNGGPRSPKAPCTAAGLPDGYYAFQVTDPSGQVVLSTDDLSQRIVQVLGGVIVASFSHPTGTGKCNSETVQLMPFNDTPNPGGEYKVWMAPINPSGPFGSFVFTPRESQTDNYKEVACVPDPTNNFCGGGTPPPPPQ